MNTSSAADRIEKIRTALIEALNPKQLDVIDEGHLHAGHAGAKSGLGHFRVLIVADKFSDLNLIKRHRLVYESLGDLMKTDIHALSIDARTLAEADPA